MSRLITITGKQLVLFLAFLGFLFLLVASGFNIELVAVLGFPSLVLWAGAELLAQSPGHHSPATDRHRLRTFLVFLPGVVVVGITLLLSGFWIIEVAFLLGLTYLVLRSGTQPLSRLFARLGYSIRWKFELAIVSISALLLVVTLIQVAAMNYMHDELHRIQEIGQHQPTAVLRAVDALEATHHGVLFPLLPWLSILGVILAAIIGAAMAWSVIRPVRRMEGAMERISSGDFSEPLQVENRDELGELADRINQAAGDLARLQAATLAAERAHAMRERMNHVMMAQEEERRRISRELHDGLGPSLVAIGNRLRVCQYMVDADPAAAKKEMDEVNSSLRGHVQEIRELIHGLRPLLLDQVGLVGAIRQQVERFSQESGIRTSISLGTAEGVALEPLTELTVFRVVQESLTNVHKHAAASEVDVTLQLKDSHLETMVRDNGRGFDTRDLAAGATGRGLGLLSMQERAELLGGSLSVHSSPGSGCEIVLSVPTREVQGGTDTSAAGG